MIKNQDKAIKCGDTGIERFCKQLNTKFEVLESTEKGHRIVKTPKETFYVVFKKRWFETFGTVFNHEETEGESLNLNVLLKLQDKNIETIVFVHPNNIYFTYTKLFVNVAIAQNLIRETDKLRTIKTKGGKLQQVSELTYSIPKSQFTEFSKYKEFAF